MRATTKPEEFLESFIGPHGNERRDEPNAPPWLIFCWRGSEEECIGFDGNGGYVVIVGQDSDYAEIGLVHPTFQGPSSLKSACFAKTGGRDELGKCYSCCTNSLQVRYYGTFRAPDALNRGHRCYIPRQVRDDDEGNRCTPAPVA